MEKFRSNERATFLKKLEKIPKQQQQALIEKLLQKAVRAEGRMDLKRMLNKIHTVVNPSIAPARQLRVRPSWRRVLGWAAAASVLLLSPFWLLNRSASPQELISQHYQAYELSVLTRDEGQDPHLLAANSFYQQGNYKKAIPAFESALSIKPQGQLYLGLGISYWESGEYHQAQKQLKHLYQMQDPLLKDQAVWYLGLLAMQQNDLEQTKYYLNMLCDNPRADHHLEAKKIIEQLK